MLRGEEANWLAESRWTDMVSICIYVRVCKEKDDDSSSYVVSERVTNRSWVRIIGLSIVRHTFIKTDIKMT
jgi:hypothetical protein